MVEGEGEKEGERKEGSGGESRNQYLCRMESSISGKGVSFGGG